MQKQPLYADKELRGMLLSALRRYLARDERRDGGEEVEELKEGEFFLGAKGTKYQGNYF